MLTLTLLLACVGGTKSDDTSAAADDSAQDSNQDSNQDSTPACEAMNSGDDWAWMGECPQMRTACDIVVDGCSLTIDYTADGGMTMGMPYAGTIEGSTITFEDGDDVPGCVGTLEDADTVSGTCASGCSFTLRR